MTSRTSWFNGGVFRSTVRRYRLGSVLYLVLLVLSTVLPILFGIDPQHYYPTKNRVPLILEDVYFYLPLVTSMIVPTVVALLVYRFVHSKKTSIFVHSLPVSRNANYVSTVAAALTLMAVPVVVNGLVLMLIAVCGYQDLFGVSACLIWIGVNLLAIFLMFSAATFAAFLSGNSFAMVALNGLLHLIAVAIAGGISALSHLFLYGYYDTGALLDLAGEWNFVWYLANIRFDPELTFAWGHMGLMLGCALVLYVGAWLLYRHRRMETAEDVAAYKCLNPIFKYLLTLAGATAAFLLVSDTLKQGILLAVIVVLIISAVIYFGSEMILKKNLKIWRSYRGYLAFLAVFAALLSFFAFTEVFGFESRVPELEQVETVAILENGWYQDAPFVEVEEIKEYAIDLHGKFIAEEERPVLYGVDAKRFNVLTLVYRLKNGKSMTRRYFVSEEELCRVMDDLYEWREYKLANIELFQDISGEILSIDVGPRSIDDPKQIEELMTCLTSELLELDYTEIRQHNNVWNTHVHVEYRREEMEDASRIYTAYQNVNANFARTVEWMKKNGCWDSIFNGAGYDLTVLTADQWKAYTGAEEDLLVEAASYKEVMTVSRKAAPKFEEIPGAVRITDGATKAAIREIVLTTPARYEPERELMYYVCSITPEGYVNPISAFYDDAAGVSKFTK